MLRTLTSADDKELGISEVARQREHARPQRARARAFGQTPRRPKPRSLDPGEN